MTEKPITLGELAERLGHSHDWLSRPGRLERLYAEGMPRPLTMFGRRRWDRRSMLAWLERHHPAAIKDHAPTPTPAPLPTTDEAWQTYIAASYPPHGGERSR